MHGRGLYIMNNDLSSTIALRDTSVGGSHEWRFNNRTQTEQRRPDGEKESLQFREQHRAQILNHLIPHRFLHRFFQMPLWVLFTYVPRFELLWRQGRLFLH